MTPMPSQCRPSWGISPQPLQRATPDRKICCGLVAVQHDKHTPKRSSCDPGARGNTFREFRGTLIAIVAFCGWVRKPLREICLWAAMMPECICNRFCSIGLWCLHCTGMFMVVSNIGIVFELVGSFVRATTLLLLRHVRVCFVSKIALVVVWACLNGLLQLGRFGRLRGFFVACQ